MLRADSRFWLVYNREIWSRISRLTSSACDIKIKERHWWRHNGDSDRRPLSLPLRYDLVTLCLYGDLGQINVIAGILKLRKRFKMSQILFEHGINSLPLVCWRGYGNLSTRSIAIPRAAEGQAWYCNAKSRYQSLWIRVINSLALGKIVRELSVIVWLSQMQGKLPLTIRAKSCGFSQSTTTHNKPWAGGIFLVTSYRWLNAKKM